MEKKINIKELREEVLRKINVIFKINNPQKMLKLTEFIFPNCISSQASPDAIMDNIEEEIKNRGGLLTFSNNILRVIAIYIICKYKKWMNESDEKYTAHLSKYNSDERVLNILRNMYHQFDLNYDIIQFIILNTQIALSKRDSVFGFGANKIGIDDSLSISGVPYNIKNQTGSLDYIEGANLVDCMSLVQVYCKFLSAEFGARNLEENDRFKVSRLLSNFNSLLEAFKIFRHIDIIINEDNSIFFDDDGEILETYHILRHYVSKNNVSQIIYLTGLRRENKEGSSRIGLKYSNFLDTTSFFFKTYLPNETINSDLAIVCDSFEDLYIKITGHILGKREEAWGKSGLLSYNYKYINKLSLAIVDSIEEGQYLNCRENLVALMKKNEYFFINELEQANLLDDDESNDEYDALNWDLVLTKLLTFESPTRVLRTLLNDGKIENIDIIDKVIINLNLRLQDSFNVDNVFANREEIMKEVKNQLVIFNEGKDLVSKEFKTKWENHIKLEATIRSLVDALSDAKENNFDQKHGNGVYTNSIYEKITFLKNMENYVQSNAYVDVESIKKSCDTMICDVMRVFLCFYKGLIGSVSERLSYETESFNKYLTYQEIKEWQIRIETAMFDAINARAKELAALTTPKEFLLELKRTYDACFINNNIDNMQNDGKSIRAVLGRNMLMYSELRKIVHYSNNDSNAELIYYNRGNIEYISFEDINENNVRHYLYAVKQFIEFLAGISETNGKMSKFRQMIYPATATFSGNTVNRDKNSLMKFSLILEDGTTNHFVATEDNRTSAQSLNEVNISTEFEYQINDHFYCLPNIDRMTDQLWADPILVQCERFDKIIKDSLKK